MPRQRDRAANAAGLNANVRTLGDIPETTSTPSQPQPLPHRPAASRPNGNDGGMGGLGPDGGEDLSTYAERPQRGVHFEEVDTAFAGHGQRLGGRATERPRANDALGGRVPTGPS